MTGHAPFDSKTDWANPYCGNHSNDPLVDKLIGNAYHVVRTVYCNLGNLKLIYDFLNQYGMVLGVKSEDELKALTTEASYARIYGNTPAGDRQVTDYLYVEGDRTGILPNDPDATGSWVKVATSGDNGGESSSGDGGYLPWVFANGSAAGGETTIRVPDGTIGVPFVIVNGFMNYVGKGFTYDAATFTITLSQPLEQGDEVVCLLTGVPAIPDNPNVNDWIQINWLYNNGAAVGGEQVIAVPYTFQDITAVYKNGLRLYKGLTDKSYSLDTANQRFILTEPLVTNDRIIAQIGGEAAVLDTPDRTIEEVARSTNLKDSEIILSTDTVQSLNNKKVVYSVSEQKSYGLPSLPTNVYIQTVANGQLTYNPGNVVVDLLEVPNAATESLREELASVTGYTLVPSIQLQNWKDIGDIRGWGAVEGQDCTAALQEAINSRGANGWGTSSDVIINGNYKIEGKVFLTTDVRLIGNWATITSTSNDWIIETGYKNSSGIVVTNHGLNDNTAIFDTRLKGTLITGITFVGVSKVLHLNCFTERCGIEDVAFENCGVCWDARLSFYPYYKNILIRGVKAGFESSYAYQLRHQCNQITFDKVTISGREFGELLDDDIVPTNPIPFGVHCQHINHIDCTYEGMTTAVMAKMKTVGYTNTGIYAEVISDNMFVFSTNEHYDLKIVPRWFAGVEKQGHFNNIKGRSFIVQGKQYDYIPAKRSALQFGQNSVVTVESALSDETYQTSDVIDNGIAFDGTSKVRLKREWFTSNDVPVKEDSVNFARVPVTLTGFIPHVDNVAIGITGKSYDSGTDSLSLTTDIYWSVSNIVVVGLRIYQTSNPSNTFNATGLILNGFASQFAGQTLSYSNVGGLTTVKIAQPGGPSGASWMTSGDYTVEGCVRLL